MYLYWDRETEGHKINIILGSQEQGKHSTYIFRVPRVQEIKPNIFEFVRVREMEPTYFGVNLVRPIGGGGTPPCVWGCEDEGNDTQIFLGSQG